MNHFIVENTSLPLIFFPHNLSLEVSLEVSVIVLGWHSMDAAVTPYARGMAVSYHDFMNMVRLVATASFCAQMGRVVFIFAWFLGKKRGRFWFSMLIKSLCNSQYWTCSCCAACYFTLNCILNLMCEVKLLSKSLLRKCCK